MRERNSAMLRLPHLLTSHAHAFTRMLVSCTAWAAVLKSQGSIAVPPLLYLRIAELQLRPAGNLLLSTLSCWAPKSHARTASGLPNMLTNRMIVHLCSRNFVTFPKRSSSTCEGLYQQLLHMMRRPRQDMCSAILACKQLLLTPSLQYAHQAYYVPQQVVQRELPNGAAFRGGPGRA